MTLRLAPWLTSSLLALLPLTAKAQTAPEAVLRTDGPFEHVRLNANRQLMAYTDQRGQSLRVLDTNNQEIIEVTKHRVGASFFWSPDGKRLFYRELTRDKNQVSSAIKAYEFPTAKTVDLETLPGSSGFLTLDPRDYTFLLMHEKGSLSRRLEFPGERLARWQKRTRPDEGRWIVSQKAALWLSDLGLTLQTLKDDGTGVESFDISPDGQTLAWATNDARIFVSKLGEKPRFLARGRDPRWHPNKALLLFAGAREIGPKAYDYDVRIVDLKGEGRFLTATPSTSERWPQWWDDDSVIYTREGSTDLWRLRLKNPPIAQTPSSEAEKTQ